MSRNEQTGINFIHFFQDFFFFSGYSSLYFILDSRFSNGREVGEDMDQRSTSTELEQLCRGLRPLNMGRLHWPYVMRRPNFIILLGKKWFVISLDLILNTYFYGTRYCRSYCDLCDEHLLNTYLKNNYVFQRKSFQPY